MVQTILYVDPGSGSYLIQIIIAGVLGAVFYIKTFWYKIKSIFTKKKSGEDDGIESE
ncbi:MAG: hypothetical protein JWO92_2109 [Chitinophagaceae bacterium]|nr:hypothetical protein [Chitinophagaceae bacterium]MDB5224349.1 hypothetical protein [Chitinophagaceae bacterium]